MSKLYLLDGDADFNPEAPRVADLENATDITPYLMTQYRNVAYVGGRGYGKVAHQQTMLKALEGADYAITREQMEAAYLRGMKPHYLGNGEYTPADELRDRLNDSLQGKQPALPVNTRYWRDQK